MTQPIRAEDHTEADSDEVRQVLAELAAVAGDRPDWQDHGLCAQTDPEAFYPEKGGSTREAKQVCNRCPVRENCLEHVLAVDERFGIWAGMSERERRTLIPKMRAERDRARAAAAAEAQAEAERSRTARESIPPPRGRPAATQMAATLPTEARPPRVRRQGPRSTFPERARRAPTDQPTPTPAAPTRPTRRSPAPNTRRNPAPSGRRGASEQPSTETATVRYLGDRSGEPTAGGAHAAEPVGEQAADLAAPTPIPAARPPDHTGAGTRELLGDAVGEVLAVQARALGELDIDPQRVRALAVAGHDGDDLPDREEWELRVAAVALVISGARTRGRTARVFGRRSQDVAHWVRRHLEEMVLMEGAEQRC